MRMVFDRILVILKYRRFFPPSLFNCWRIRHRRDNLQFPRSAEFCFVPPLELCLRLGGRTRFETLSRPTSTRPTWMREWPLAGVEWRALSTDAASAQCQRLDNRFSRRGCQPRMMRTRPAPIFVLMVAQRVSPVWCGMGRSSTKECG